MTGPRPARPRSLARRLAPWCLLVAGATLAEGQGSSELDTLWLSSDLRVRVLHGRDVELEVRPAPGDGYPAVAARVGADARSIAAANEHEPVTPETWVRLPFELLGAEYRQLVLLRLFPEDSADGDAWVHVVGRGRLSTWDEGLWQVALWFTGDGQNYPALMEANRLSSPELRRGQRVRIPGPLLDEAWRPGRRSDDGSLVYGSDQDGPFAGYRLQEGEALYSAVVVRLTGRTAAEDVVALADQIARRSGIRDLRDIPVGFLVKIPLDLLEPPFLPAGHPRRLEAERARQELADELARQPVAGTPGGLEGVLVVVDPGHGGVDLGTMNNGIWEHDYVYDVACRLKQKLERETSATVRLTVIDAETGCEPSTGDELVANRQGTVQTRPPFRARKNGESEIGVNLRWYLANSIYRRALGEGREADRIVFLSLHADSRHPSLRGVMVYVPGAAYRTRTYGHARSVYDRYAEVREKRYVKFSKKDRVRSEAVSREYAEAVVRSFRKAGLPVQTHMPVRNRIIRGKSRFVPAVLRGNAIPNKVLVEMVNLSNRDDAALLASAAERERLASALLRSLRLHFGAEPDPIASR